MTRLIVLDSGPIGHATKAKGHPDAEAFWNWAKSLNSAPALAVPEIVRYETRRELFRIKSNSSLRRLDRLHPSMIFLPITSEIIDIASELWAQVRQAGLPTDHDEGLDGDAILAATAIASAHLADEVLIATGNVGHLSRFPGVEAREWWAIR